MSHPKFVKVAANRELLPDDATHWDAVLLPEHGLMFTATSVPAAGPSASAWAVDFSDGGVYYYYPRSFDGFALTVRRASPK